MKRILLLLITILLVLPIVGCQPQKPANAIPVQDAKFKYRGNMIWLYRDAGGKVNMLRGNTRDITAVTTGNGEFFDAGKGQTTTIANVTKDQFIYVKNQLLGESQKKQVISQPDYVLSVSLKDLAAKIPDIKNDEALNVLKAEFESELLLDRNPLVTITMDSGSKIILELYPDIAPNTVNSFISLLQKGFYNGVIFHRVSPGFMIQGGDPQGVGIGGPGYSIKGEFTANGFNNPLKHTRGVISMARGEQSNDSAGSQFFLMVADAPHLDGQYASFGKVLSGMETVDLIANLKRDPETERPLQPPTMQSLTVETYGATYPAPFIISGK